MSTDREKPLEWTLQLAHAWPWRGILEQESPASYLRTQHKENSDTNSLPS